MRKFVIALLSVVCLLDLTGCHHSTTKDKGKETVTITRRVTDFEGHPIDLSIFVSRTILGNVEPMRI